MKKCTKCGFDNFDEAYLCRKCGSKLKKIKNKSLDLDIQNSSATSQNYQQNYQQSYQQQAYQGQTYNPYAQQQYQQQYHSNQAYQNTYYDTYQGQQYQQAQSQNRGNANLGGNYNQYNNGYYDNSYANDYQGSQTGFTNQDIYGNNNYNNSFTDNQQQTPRNNSQQYSGAGNNNSDTSFTESRNGTNYTFTDPSSRVSPMGNSQPSGTAFNPATKQFNDTSGQYTQTNLNERPKNAKEFLINEYRNAVNPAEIHRYKPKIFPLVGIIAFLVLISTALTILASVWYHSSVDTYTSNSSSSSDDSYSIDSSTDDTVSIEDLPELAMNETVYTLTAENDSSIRVEFQIPEHYSAIPKYFADSHIGCEKRGNNVQNNETEELVYTYIAIKDTNFEDELNQLQGEYKDLPDTDYKEYVTDTPLGEMHCLSIFGGYYGIIPLGENNCLYISSNTTFDQYKPEAEATILCVANSLKQVKS